LGKALSGFFDNQPAAIVAAFGAYAVIKHGYSTVGTGGQGRYFGFIVGTAFIPALFGDFVFWMCHIN
jgi:hypothetical protein